MNDIITATDLCEYRRLRIKYLISGRSGMRPTNWEVYQELDRRVRSAVGELEEPYRTVAEMYWIGGMSCMAVGMRIYYSERHVRRIRDAAREDIVRT